ncbi:hypothetical protein D187_000657 [Cystobacter fuscus DSM 2262]|uniref:Uncharacterized protein n=1 Tax=Cystobacter fuscus (strain ATCC 25194 / DSM 2262 / NBRC 100088 / M29) TaxID=1242864 RepID=S9PRT7_CYSF2|nr:hypothetical protein D187_000657 [Cystobacter fuscus DSM 2262]
MTRGPQSPAPLSQVAAHRRITSHVDRDATRRDGPGHRACKRRDPPSWLATARDLR